MFDAICYLIGRPDLMAPAPALPTGWTACPTCKVEHTSPDKALHCRVGHAIHTDRAMFRTLGERPRSDKLRSAVYFSEDGVRVCGPCSSKAAKDAVFMRVEMLDPPACSRCGRQIEPDPIVEFETPSFLKPSERYDNRRLDVGRRRRVELFRRDLHRELVAAEARSVLGGESPLVDADLLARGCALDERITNEFGGYVDDPDAGLTRLPTCGYIRVDEDQEETEVFFK